MATSTSEAHDSVEKTGNVKATRDDWIKAARSKLDSVAIDELKILNLAEDLEVSRSSFYWYFDDIVELREELFAKWRNSTTAIVERVERPADNITSAILGIFACWVDPELFDPQLEFAIRDWGRRNDEVATLVEAADEQRLDALATMFGRYGFASADSTVRARLLYHGQLGYHLVGTNEPTERRLSFLPSYLETLTDVEPSQELLDEFADFFRGMQPD